MAQSIYSHRSAAVVIIVLGVAASLLALVMFALNVLIPLYGNAFDFYPNWSGARAVLSGESPYTRAVTERIQIGMFGSAGANQGDEHSFAHPAYSAILLLPVAVLDAPLATAIWMTFQIGAITVSILLWIHMLGWWPRPLTFGLVLLGTLLLFRHPVDVFLLGQFPGSILLGFSLSTWLLLRRQDALSGLTLILCVVPPTVGGTLALAHASSLLLVGRWKVLATLLGVLALMSVLSFMLIGFWIPDWLEMLSQYSHYANPIWPPLQFGDSVPAAVFAFLVLSMLGQKLAQFVRYPDTAHLLDLALTLLAGGLLLLPTTGTYYLVLVLPLIVAALARGSLAASGLALCTLLCPWLFWIVTDGMGTSVELLVLPTLAWASWQLALRCPRVREQGTASNQAAIPQ